MSRPIVRSRDLRIWADLLLALLWCALLFAPIVLVAVYLNHVVLFPDGAAAQPLPPIVHVTEVWVAVAIMVISAAGMLVAWFTDRLVQASVFLATLLIGVCGAAAAGQVRSEPGPQAPRPSSTITQCIPRSGSTHGCPGG